MGEWNSQTVQLNDISLHYYRLENSGKPSILFLHGYHDSGRCWQHVAEALASEYDMVMPDARYHGLTSGSGDVQDTTLANDVLALIDYLHLERPTLVGHSMGAHVAALAASMRPELVGSVVLEDPAWEENFVPDAERERIELEAWKSSTKIYKTVPQEEALEEARLEHPNWALSDIEPWIEAQRAFNLDIYTVLTNTAQAPWRETPWRELVTRISCPILLLSGEVSRGGFVTPATASEIVQRATQCQHIHIPGAGHNLRRDNFDAFMQALRSFLPAQ